MVDKTSSEPIYLQIQKELHRQILAGDLPPGMQIPSETELADQYSVSRMTARKSIDGLVAKGVLYRRAGKGTFVSEASTTYGFSTMLSFSRELSRRGFKVTTRILQKEVVPGPPYVCEKLHLTPGTDLCIVRRLRIVNDKPMAVHTSYLDYRVYSPVLEYDLTQESILEVIENTRSTNTSFTRDTIRAVNADKEICQLLDLPDHGAIIEVEGVAYDDKGRPVRFSRALYRGDEMTLTVRNTQDQSSLLAIIQGE